ncbi:MAG: GNAT family N-acetyltransferase [Candidatus Lokiarchaeota archaeon]|nr:GNAT family N-acetyltransferase [Candidatus Lokiarchaeota archaeon]
MKIEKFTMESYEDIVDLWRKSGISVGSTDTKNEIERMLQRNPNLFLIGKIDNKVIGAVMGGFDGRRGYVHHLAIDPDYQRRGFGTMIIENLIKKFRKIGVHKVHLFIEKDNKELVEFYMNLGWEIRDDLIMMSLVPDEKLYKSNL